MRMPFVSRWQYDFIVRLWEKADADLLAARMALDTAALSRAEEREQREARFHEQMAELHTMYERIIETQASAQKAAIEHAMNLVTYGSPTKKEAIVEEREPDAMVRASREVDQQTIVRAMDSLRTNYAAIGVPVTEEELRIEATGLVTGAPWSAPASLQGFLKD